MTRARRSRYDGSVQATLAAGEIAGASVANRVYMHWPMFLLDVELPAGAGVRVPASNGREAAVYVVEGEVVCSGRRGQSW